MFSENVRLDTESLPDVDGETLNKRPCYEHSLALASNTKYTFHKNSCRAKRSHV